MAALEGNVKLPGVGEVSKKKAAIGAAIVFGLLGIAYYRHAKNAASTNANPAGGTAAGSAGTTGQVTDPAGNVCAAVDGSGYCPGTDQSNAWQSEQSGYYGSTGYDQFGGYGGGGGGYGTGGGECSLPDGTIGYLDSLGNCIPFGQGSGTTGTGSPTTAAQWVTATAPLVPGSAATFEAAAAKVFAGLTVTTAQKDLFLEGVGLNPLPPGITYPQPIKTSDTSGHPGAGKVTVPKVVGLRAEDAGADITAAGLNPHVTPGTPHGKIGHITAQSPAGGSQASKGSTVTLTNKIT